MSRQDKATTERNTKTLREFVKRPENKVCADCKRNDPRWASWNIGVYLCIRCSGIHRGMGTHISKVKSIDLDTWTPEQMQSIEKWGNRRANLYWEAHLKQGHVPPDHKMDSFIRSKYESRRWAMDGPPPTDPSVLADGLTVSDVASAPEAQASPLTQPTSSHTIQYANSSLSRSSAATPPLTNRQPQPHQLLSTSVAAERRGQPQAPLFSPPQAQAQSAPVKQPEPENDLFSLDFHAPPSNSSTSSGSSNQTQQQGQPKKDVKQDILSLFSTPAATSPSSNAFGQFQSSPSSASPWGSVPQQQPQATSMMGTNGAGAWGASSGWNAPPAAPPAQGNLWGNPVSAPASTQPKQPDLFGGDIWSGGSAGGGGGTDPWGGSSGAQGGTAQTSKKDDAFGDIWGGFK